MLGGILPLNNIYGCMMKMASGDENDFPDRNSFLCEKHPYVVSQHWQI